jgi:alpha-mannosidase
MTDFSPPLPLSPALDDDTRSSFESALTQQTLQNRWHQCHSDLTPAQIQQRAQGSDGAADGAADQVGALNAKGQIVWPKGRHILWLYQQFQLPNQLQGYPLAGLTVRLALTWWAEDAQIYVNGEWVQAGDLFDHSTRIVLSRAAAPGALMTVALRLVSPGHDDGALMKSQLLFESDYSTDRDLDPGFIADELAVLHSYLRAFAADQGDAVAAAVAKIDWAKVADRSDFNTHLQALRTSLLPLTHRLKQHTIYLLGHAHLDMAWLWPIAETWQAAERTFTSALALQSEFAELTFAHTTPALFAWLEVHRPELFARIQAQVRLGRWEMLGGIWVEPEVNLISGESMARQILYGQRYYLEKFGQISPIAWLPDTFGFHWQLPQLLKQGGIDYFVTQKLRWNDTTQTAPR